MVRPYTVRRTVAATTQGAGNVSQRSGLELRPASVTDADFSTLFAALPTAFLVMTPDLVIVHANPAYLTTTDRLLADIVGRPVFEAFPPQPGSLDEHGRNPVQLSFERARDTGQVDHMPLTKYDLYRPDGDVQERYWSLITAPVLDADGRVTLIIQRVEDVTPYVGERRLRQATEHDGPGRRRVEVLEADLYARTQRLREAVEAEAVATRRLAGMAEAALQLAGAETIEELVDVVAGAGLAALGAEGGAITVATEDGFRLAITDSLGAETQRRFSDLPPDSDAPAVWAIRHAQPMLLPTRASGEAWSDKMPAVYETTGCMAWAIVPLVVGERVLGSLSAAWADEREFSPSEVEMMTVFAAQCAQVLDRIQVRTKERREAAANRTIAEALQRSLLTDPPHLPRLQLAVRYRPASGAQVGGDWYDAFTVNGTTTTLVIGDVTGHDLEAAAAMGQLRNLLRGVAHVTGESPAEVLSALDRSVASLHVDTLATAAIAQITVEPDRDTAVVSWSNAGHPPPLLVTETGEATLLTSEADLLLGLDPTAQRRDHGMSLVAGATMVLYTDGLVERRGESLDVGLERLRAAAGDLSRLPVEGFCDELLARMADRHLDDIALLAVRLEGMRP